MTQARAITLNALSLYGVALVLAAAYAAQFILQELPCPLCLLQRILFAALAVGPILNIRFGPSPSHYAMSLLAAVAGAVASTRQVLLHILPGDAGYGSALLGYHYYTWALIGFIAAMMHRMTGGRGRVRGCLVTRSPNLTEAAKPLLRPSDRGEARREKGQDRNNQIAAGSRIHR